MAPEKTGALIEDVRSRLDASSESDRCGTESYGRNCPKLTHTDCTKLGTPNFAIKTDTSKEILIIVASDVNDGTGTAVSKKVTDTRTEKVYKHGTGTAVACNLLYHGTVGHRIGSVVKENTTGTSGINVRLLAVLIPGAENTSGINLSIPSTFIDELPLPISDRVILAT